MAQLTLHPERNAFSLIGVPTDIGAGTRGASMGPEALRVAGIAQAIGSISAVARHCRAQGKKLRVLWFDAHADFNTANLTPSGNIHGMPVACLCGQGPRALVEMGMRSAMELALALVDKNIHLHVSLDVDFLDPDIAPGVGTTVRGGPTYREAQLCMEMIADTGRMASLDIVELNPAFDIRNRTAEINSKLGRP